MPVPAEHRRVESMYGSAQVALQKGETQASWGLAVMPHCAAPWIPNRSFRSEGA